ncbi:MAG: FdhF/YdeP family oxidoreductase [Planctomycetaceae bacterium]|nr:FdhF/YdeP family oxidoreductase [Planctomycetaceae bacterium]
MKFPKAGGGWQAIRYSLRLASRVGWWKMWSAMRSRNACKTCAVGMGGQLGGMVNEGGYFPEVCKKSFQAMASDMQKAIPERFFQANDIHRLRAMSPRQLENAGRLAFPVVLESGSSHYQPIDWETAFDRIADALAASGPDRSFFYCSGRSSNEAGFLLQLLSRMLGTNYVNNCSYYCHQASGVGLGRSIGTGAGTIRLEDLDHTDLYILIGANPASNHPRLIRTLMQIRRRGGRVIVINPMVETGLVRFRVPSDVRSLLFGSDIASQYVQPHIGGDPFLLAGLCRYVLDQQACDDDFIRNHTDGFQQFAESVKNLSWDTIIEGSGVDRETIESVGQQYVQAKNVVIGWCMGITHHLHGTENVMAIANLALLRGMVGRTHAGLMPIRGHSNVQGLGSVGVTPVLKQKMLQQTEQQLGIKVPESPGYDTMACMEAAARGEMDFALCLGGNLYGSNPDLRYAMEALHRIRTVVSLSTTLNNGHAWGTGKSSIILPVLARDEESQATTQESMFSFVRLSSGGPQRIAGPKSEVQVLSEIGRRLMARTGQYPDFNWTRLENHAAIRELIASMVPGYEPMAELNQNSKEFHVTGRAVRDYRFPTENGRAQFQTLQLPGSLRSPDSLRLMTIRSEGQFNSVVYDEEDLYRKQDRRDVILMNESDIQRLGLMPDQRVTVRSEAGAMQYILVRPFQIRAGNAAMYYPEANILVPHQVDPLSRTPAFKAIPITIHPEESSQ